MLVFQEYSRVNPFSLPREPAVFQLPHRKLINHAHHEMGLPLIDG